MLFLRRLSLPYLQAERWSAATPAANGRNSEENE
jgi:hypothetical protein